MRSFWKLISSPNFLPVLIVLFFGVLASRHLFTSGYFKMHDDLQMMRQLEMEKCFLDLQIPCRWVPDMGYGYGFPLFNFYPPFPYLVGEGIRVTGTSFVDTVKLNFALSIIVSGIAMYFLAKEFFGRIGGVLSAVFYIWAPYHAVDVYVRGALNEAWALAWFPLIFFYSYKLITNHKTQITKSVIFLALSWFALLTSHNLIVLIFIPLFASWCLLFLAREKAWNRLPHLFIVGVLALGLAAFFTLPALFENKFTQVRSQLTGYYEYTAHFVSLRQLLISRFWGYGPSVWVDAEDGMSFQIGHVHWVLSLLVGAILLIKIWFKRGRNFWRELLSDKLFVVTSYLLTVGWFSAFLTHLRSIFIYQAVPQLGYIQFPWRFLTIVIFAFSFIVGIIPGVVAELKSRLGFWVKILITPPQIFISILLVLLLVALNWNYFKPEGGKMGPLTDKEKFSGAAWELQQTAGIYDYLPISAKTAPKGPPQGLVELLNGNVDIRDERSGTNWAEFTTDVESDGAFFRFNILNFPGWKVYVDGREGLVTTQDDELGRIHFEVAMPGVHKVRAELTDTWPRTLGNLISSISWVGLVIYFYSHRKSANV